MEEVAGSIPARSTNFPNDLHRASAFSDGWRVRQSAMIVESDVPFSAS